MLPLFCIWKILNKFLSSVFDHKNPILTAPKKVLYISLPFTVNASIIKRELTKFLANAYPCVDFRFIFKNTKTLSSIFHFKDPLPDLMRSCSVYLFNCPNCKSGTYIGCTKRLLKVRIDAHRGVSYRTGSFLSNKEQSSIRSHCQTCKCNIDYKHFKILCQSPNQQSLYFLESLYNKHLSLPIRYEWFH